MGTDTQRRTASIGGVPLKYISLVTLTFQNSALILIMRYSRIMPLVGGHRYFTSTAVLLNEVFKLIVSFGMAMHETSEAMPGSSVTQLLPAVSKSIFTSDSWKLAIPAILYTFQNSLQYVAVSNLDAATFQITYQLKILTTALFSVTMLKRTLSVKKWISLVLLMAGVAVVQIPSGGGDGKAAPTTPDSKTPPNADERRSLMARADGAGAEHTAGGNATVGLIAVLIACAISGLAGVYFEKVLKDSSAQVSLWVRNVQLSFYSLFPAFFIGVMIKDGAAISKDGFFAGYNWIVWLAITFQAGGGLIVALVVNYADNIAKNFATSISIILSLLASVWLFDFTITVNFMIGMFVVLYATYLYSSPERKPAEQDRAANSSERGEHELEENERVPKGESDSEQAPFMADQAPQPPMSPTLRSPRTAEKE